MIDVPSTVAAIAASVGGIITAINRHTLSGMNGKDALLAEKDLEILRLSKRVEELVDLLRDAQKK